MEECTHAGSLIPAKNYAPGNVECARCGALWLACTPSRVLADDLVGAIDGLLVDLQEHTKPSGYRCFLVGKVPIAALRALREKIPTRY